VAQDIVRYELRDDVAVLHFDDGKANAFSHAAIEALHAQLDRADKDAKAVLLVGRPERFSAGFDLAVMRGGGDAVRGLVTAGAELFLRIFALPQPLVAACTGHALAAGAIALLVADARLGVRGEFKIGLNEVGIGMTLPLFAIEFARHRLSKRHFQRAAIQAEIYAPEGAVDAGFLDRVVGPESLLEAAFAEAARLAALPQPAFAHTKARARAATLTTIRAGLEDDMRGTTRGPTA
jgi:enoyl-CoA hydratase